MPTFAPEERPPEPCWLGSIIVEDEPVEPAWIVTVAVASAETAVNSAAVAVVAVSPLEEPVAKGFRTYTIAYNQLFLSRT